MITKKIWKLVKPDATRVDATYIIGLGCEVEVVLPEPLDFTTNNGTRWHYVPEHPHIKIMTTCKKQESMLYLKYGDELKLEHTIHSLPETYTVIPGYENLNMAPHSRSSA